MKNLLIGIAVIVVVAVVILLVVTQTSRETHEIRIGAIIPLTGNNAVYGVALKNGIDLAIEDINGEGGINGRKLQVVTEDSQADPQKGVSAFTKLATVNKVPMVMGAMFSAVTLAIAPVAEKRRVVLISPTSSAVELTTAGDYIFRIYPSDSYDGKFLATFAADRLKTKAVSILYIQVASVTAITKVFRQTFEHKGGEILEVQGYNEGETDFRGIF